MVKKTSSEIMKRASMWNLKSKEIQKECLKYKIKFIDVSYNRSNIFKQLIKELNEDEKFKC